MRRSYVGVSARVSNLNDVILSALIEDALLSLRVEVGGEAGDGSAGTLLGTFNHRTCRYRVAGRPVVVDSKTVVECHP